MLPPSKPMSKDDFIKLTKAFGRSRSAELKRIDELLGQRDQDLRIRAWTGDDSALKVALKRWMDKEANWERSVRNTSGAITSLLAELNAKDKPSAVSNEERVRARLNLQRGQAAVAVDSEHASHARLGIIYLFAQTRVELDTRKFFTLGVASRTPSQYDKSGNLQQPLFHSDGKPDPAVTASQTIREEISEFVKEQWKKFRRKTASSRYSTLSGCLDTVWPVLAYYVKEIVSELVAKVAPFMSGGLATIKGVKTLCDNLFTRIDSYLGGRGVTLNDGHPAIIVTSVNDMMDNNIGKGLYETLKGTATLALDLATAGASTVVNAFMWAMEKIVLLMNSCFEIAQINAFCQDCKERYARRDEPNSIHKAPDAFGPWFNRAVIEAPAIAGLTLLSGMAGDKMQYLKMFSAGDSLIKQDAFDRGVAYLDALKDRSRKYLQDTCYVFLSEDRMIQGRLIAARADKHGYLNPIAHAGQ